MTLPHTSHQNL